MQNYKFYVTRGLWFVENVATIMLPIWAFLQLSD